MNMVTRLVRRSSDEGFTVLEFTYAALILFIVAMGVMAVFGYAVQSSQSSSVKITALNLANERIELVRNLPYDEVGLEYADGTPAAIPGDIVTPAAIGDYTVDTSVEWARDPDTGRALYKQVFVTVGWTKGKGGEVVVSSNVFGKSNLVNTGDLSVLVLDYDTNLPVEGARVTITDASSVSRSINVGESGEAFFGYLSTGDYDIVVTKTGYIYDYVTLPTVTVVPDLLTSVVGKLQVPSTINVTAVDTNGDPISGAGVTLRRADVPNQNATTDANGQVTFGNLLVADYTVTVTKSGYSPGNVNAPVSSGGQVVDLTVTLSPRVGLVVRASDVSDVPLSGVSVEVRGPSPATGHAPGSPKTTASNGEASFDGLVDGDYTVIVSKSGFDTQTRSVTYDGSNPPEVFTMEPVSAGSLRIRTVNSSGNGKGYEQIRITGPNGFLLIATTNSSGYYTVTGLEPGSYRIQSDWNGGSYGRTYNNIIVSPGLETYKEVRA